MNLDRLTALLGLAQKAGKLAAGEQAVEKSIRSGKARLVLIAEDASENTRKGYRDMATYYTVPCYQILSKDAFGNAIGKSPKAALVIMDAGFVKAIRACVDV